MAPSPQDPMAGYRRNVWLVRGLVAALLVAVVTVALLFLSRSREVEAKNSALGQTRAALAVADQLKAENDALVLRAAHAKPGSPAQTQALKQLVKNTTSGIAPVDGRDGLTIVGRDGRDGLTVVGRDGRDSTVPGPSGPSGDTIPGPSGSPGAAGRDGKDGTDGKDPSGFTFTTSDGTTYDCTPDGNGHYTCTARPQPTPTPTPTGGVP